MIDFALVTAGCLAVVAMVFAVAWLFKDHPALFALWFWSVFFDGE